MKYIKNIILFIISIAILIYINNYNTIIENFNDKCPVSNIAKDFCGLICDERFNNNTYKCHTSCPSAAKTYLIDNPSNIYANFILKFYYKNKKENSEKQLSDVQKYLFNQTELSSAIKQLSNPGSRWIKIELNPTEIDQSKNLEKYINELQNLEEKDKLNNILKLLKESLIKNNTTFHFNTVPTFNEIQTLFPKDSSLNDKYNFWIKIEKDVSGSIINEYYKPFNFKCYGKIDELLIDNNFVKITNNKLGSIWKIYDKKPIGSLITSNYSFRKLIKEKIKNLSTEKWYQYNKIANENENTDDNNIDVIAKDTPFSSWLKLLISIKTPIKETDLLQNDDKKNIYQFNINEQKIINDLKKKTNLTKLNINNYIKIDDKYYRPLGNISITESELNKLGRSFNRKLKADSYIEYKNNNETFYLKIIPPIIENSKLNDKCNSAGFYINGTGDNQYVKYNTENIINNVNEINKINIDEINNLIIENGKLNSKNEIIQVLKSKFPNIENNNSYYNRSEVVKLFKLFPRTPVSKKMAATLDLVLSLPLEENL